MTPLEARIFINNKIHAELTPAKKRGTYICPFCGNGKGKDGDGITTKDNQHYKCFKCDFYGDYLNILMKINGYERERDIFDLYGLVVTSDKRSSPPSEHRTETQTNESLTYRQDFTDFYVQAQTNLIDSKGMEYLVGRGISYETAKHFNIGFIADWQSPKLLSEGKNPPPSARLIIPTSKTGYTARSINTNTPERYRFMKTGEAGFVGLEAIYHGTAPVFIVEGAIDALSVYEVGGAVCALGSTSSVDRFLKVIAHKPPVVPLIISLDNDSAGKDATTKLIKGLSNLNLPYTELNISDKYNDPNEHLMSNKEALTSLVHSTPVISVKQELDVEKETYMASSVACHMDAFMGEISSKATTPAICTGFNELDKALDGGIYEGLYVIGAISSLGKTSFVLQVADQVAQQGNDVIIFSLEMSRYELMAKSISRLTYEKCNNFIGNAKTTRDILDGTRRKTYTQGEISHINECASIYMQYSKKLYIFEGLKTIGVNEIQNDVQRHISFTGNIPVVIIDYLQILAPNDIRASDKQNTDIAVTELKRMSRDKKVPVLAVSSFNRENYAQPVSYTSFKESGAIEYSADVLIGLQFNGMDDIGKADIHKKIDEWRKANPRKIQLKVLKQRNGQTGSSVYYDYSPKYNFFKETNSHAFGSNNRINER